MNVRVRRAEPEERKKVEQLIRACGKNVRDYFEMRNKDEYWANGEVWVAIVFREGVADELVGFAVVHPLKREPVLSLYDIGVHPEWRGFGVGTKLMMGVWLGNPDHDRIRLVVDKENKVAQRVYLSWGLTRTGERETRRNGTVYSYEGAPTWSARRQA